MNLVSLIIPLLIIGCATRGYNQHQESQTRAEFKKDGVPVNWGNLSSNAKALTLEAKMANVAALRLNRAADLKSYLEAAPSDLVIDDAVVSVPIKLLTGSRQPFGDGQKNYSIALVGWPQQETMPPVVFTAVFGRRGAAHFRVLITEVSQSFIQMIHGATPPTIEGEFSDDKGNKNYVQLALDTKEKTYRAVIAENAAGELKLKNTLAGVVSRMDGWMPSKIDAKSKSSLRARFGLPTKLENRYFPVLARFPHLSLNEFHNNLPAAQRFLPNGRRAVDAPYNAKQGTSESTLSKWFNDSGREAIANFYPQFPGVHHEYESHTGSVHRTATGAVDTYVLKEKAGGNEVLYTCFDARNQKEEANWGVPSGAGWHAIGEPTKAETILNNMESTGIFAAWGAQAPFSFQEASPFEAKDSIAYRVMRPLEAFTTLQGDAHWYAVDTASKPCVTIIKHVCKPKSEFDLSCAQ